MANLSSIIKQFEAPKANESEDAPQQQHPSGTPPPPKSAFARMAAAQMAMAAQRQRSGGASTSSAGAAPPLGVQKQQSPLCLPHQTNQPLPPHPVAPLDDMQYDHRFKKSTTRDEILSQFQPPQPPQPSPPPRSRNEEEVTRHKEAEAKRVAIPSAEAKNEVEEETKPRKKPRSSGDRKREHDHSFATTSTKKLSLIDEDDDKEKEEENDISLLTNTTQKERQKPSSPPTSRNQTTNLATLLDTSIDENDTEYGAPTVAGASAPPQPTNGNESLTFEFNEDGTDFNHPAIETAAAEEEVEPYLVLDVPGSIAKYLRPYQRQGVEFLLRNYARGQGCLLADDMGLGKTIQTIAFLSAVLGKTGDRIEDQNKPALVPIQYLDRRVTSSRQPGRGRLGEEGDYGRQVMANDLYAPVYAPETARILIVCTASLRDNWHYEFDKWGTFRVCKLGGSGSGSGSGGGGMWPLESGCSHVLQGRYEVAIVTYHCLRSPNAEHTLLRVPWHVVVFDEAHAMKNSASDTAIAADRLPTRLRYGLTGTPMGNEYSDLYTILNILHPKSLGGSKFQFQKTIAAPLAKSMSKKASEADVVHGRQAGDSLRALLKPLMLRRRKDVIAHQMPKKKDHVVFCQLAPVQMEAYKRVLSLPDVQLILAARRPCPCGSGADIVSCDAVGCPGYWKLTYNQGGVLYPHFHDCSCNNPRHPIRNPLGCPYHRPNGCLLRSKYGGIRRMCPYCLIMPTIAILRKVALHLDLIKANPADKEGDPRKYLWHSQLAAAVLERDVDVMGGGVAVEQTRRHDELIDISGCGKLLALRRLLRQWESDVRGDQGRPHRVLIFSNSIRMLEITKKLVDHEGWTSSCMHGQVPPSARQEMVDEFNKPSSPVFVFLASTQTGGVGLNLTAANKVVILDLSYSPASDLQAMDRAFRIGQTRDVSVYRLVAAGTIEEGIYMRQISKQQQAAVAVEGESAEGQHKYFDAVRGQHKGELWGFRNLLGSLLEEEVGRVRAIDIIAGTEDDGEGGMRVEEIPEDVMHAMETLVEEEGQGGGRGGGRGSGRKRKNERTDAAAAMEGMEHEDEDWFFEEDDDGSEREHDTNPITTTTTATATTSAGRQQQRQQRQQGEEMMLGAANVLGMVRHDVAVQPIKRAKQQEDDAIVHQKQLAMQRQHVAEAALASRYGAAESVIHGLAAFKRMPVVEMARELVVMSDSEREALRLAFYAHLEQPQR